MYNNVKLDINIPSCLQTITQDLPRFDLPSERK